jgi:hypothetical protein
MSNRAKQVPYEGELNISPWESILTEVRRSGYRAAWIDERIEREAQAERDLEAQGHDWEPKDYEIARSRQSRELREWIKLGMAERAHGAQVAASAVRAGLSERYIESVQAEARNIAGVLQRALQAAELSDEQWMAATAELRVGLADMGRELSARHSSMGGRFPERPGIES